MKFLAICGLAAVAMLGSTCSMQPTKQPRAADTPYVVPQEHKQFVDEFEALLKKYPKAAERFRLADLGEQPMPKHAFILKCKVFDFLVECTSERVE